MTERVKRRRLVEIDVADRPTKRLWGIGYPRISVLAGVTEVAVRQAVRRGQLDPGDPLALADWIREHAEGVTRREDA